MLCGVSLVQPTWPLPLPLPRPPPPLYPTLLSSSVIPRSPATTVASTSTSVSSPTTPTSDLADSGGLLVFPAVTAVAVAATESVSTVPSTAPGLIAAVEGGVQQPFNSERDLKASEIHYCIGGTLPGPCVQSTQQLSLEYIPHQPYQYQYQHQLHPDHHHHHHLPHHHSLRPPTPIITTTTTNSIMAADAPPSSSHTAQQHQQQQHHNHNQHQQPPQHQQQQRSNASGSGSGSGGRQPHQPICSPEELFFHVAGHWPKGHPSAATGIPPTEFLAEPIGARDGDGRRKKRRKVGARGNKTSEIWGEEAEFAFCTGESLSAPPLTCMRWSRACVAGLALAWR